MSQSSPVVPSVAGVLAGYYKHTDFVEFDCPWCGKIHTASVDDDIELPSTFHVNCHDQLIRIEAYLYPPPVVGEPLESDENEQSEN